MKGWIASLIFGGAWLIVCPSAWSWTMDGDKVKFSNTEWAICRMFEHDAAVIILHRQEGYSLTFDEDVKSPPTEIQKQARANMILEANAMPIESTPEKRMAVSEQFAQRIRTNCFRFLHSQPEGKH